MTGMRLAAEPAACGRREASLLAQREDIPVPSERSSAAIKAFSREHGFVAKQMYVIDSEPAGTLDRIYANLETHLGYWARMEQQGVLFSAGPKLPADDSEDWAGGGLIIIRASSFDDARRIAREDPMHLSGARRFEITTWLMNHFRAD